MGRNIGRHIDPSLAEGNYVWNCQLCGMKFLRSDLRINGSGQLICRFHGNREGAIYLSEANADQTPPALVEPAKITGDI